MKKRLTIYMAALFAIMLFSQVCGQTFPIMITIAVSPPYYPKISLYTQQPGKIIAVITNTSAIQRQVYILGLVTGEGIRVYTEPNFKMPNPIILPSGGSFQINQNNISQVFDDKHLVYEGITENQIIQQNGVPEGDYTICMRAYDYNTNEPLSAESPQGCSNTFTITDIEPPVIINPVCGQTVYPTFPQNLIFNWTIPPGAPPVTTQYNLKIIEVLPSDRNINDAMRSATHPVFFERNTNISTLLLGPADPQLVSGKTYAFAVTAIDPKRELAFRNNGMSEVCSFAYGGSEIITNVQPIQLISPADGDTVKDLPLFRWTPMKPGLNFVPKYQLKLVEILPGQTKDSAIHNSPHLLKEIYADTFRCPGFAVEPGKNYAWQVTGVLPPGSKAISEIWAFTLPFFFVPIVSLPGLIVHIEGLADYNNDLELWVVEILLPNLEKIKVGFKDNPFLKPCDYIQIKKSAEKTVGKETWEIIKTWEKVDEAIAKKTWAKGALQGTDKMIQDAKNAVSSSIKNEEAVVGGEKKASGILDGLLKEKLPESGGFRDRIQKAKGLIDFAISDETDPESGARIAKDDVLTDLGGLGDELKKIQGKIDKALELEKAKKDDKDIKNDAIVELAGVVDKVNADLGKLKHAKDKEETAKSEKEDAIGQIDVALSDYETLVPRSSSWKTALENSKSTVSGTLPLLNRSIELKKAAIKSLEDLDDAVTKAKQFMEDALTAEQNVQKK